MTARCPHHRIECDDSVSKQCQYVKRTAASMMSIIASSRALGVEKLSPAMREYLKEAEVFLGKKY
jgi:hypothetical protein